MLTDSVDAITYLLRPKSRQWDLIVIQRAYIYRHERADMKIGLWTHNAACTTQVSHVSWMEIKWQVSSIMANHYGSVQLLLCVLSQCAFVML